MNQIQNMLTSQHPFLNGTVHNRTEQNRTEQNRTEQNSKLCFSYTKVKLFTFMILFSLVLTTSCNQVETSNVESTSANPRGGDYTSTGCLPDFTGVNTCYENNVTVNVTNHSQYPGCTFVVQLKYVKCTSTNNVSRFYLGNFVITDYSCPQFDLDLANANSSGNLTLFTDLFNENMWDAVTEYILGTANNSEYFAIVEYYTFACSKMCIYPLSKGEGPTKLVYKEVNCGTNCCNRVTNFSKINGIWVVKSTSASGETNCIATTGTCPVNTISSTSCSTKCSHTEY